MSATSVDLAVVGAGVVGLAHAYHAAKRGWRVLVLERNRKAQGASVRNFGMIWPIGQPHGELHDLALASRDHWLELLAHASLWHEPVGSLHLAYHDDEENVLAEFRASPGSNRELPTPAQTLSRAPNVRADGLRAALWSPTEVCVDPRQVIAQLPAYLERELGVLFRFATSVTRVEGSTLHAGSDRFEAKHVLIASGDDIQSLYPEHLAACGFLRCKLQMMRTGPVPGGWRLGPMLAAGLTLRHYRSFEHCPSLPRLRERFARESPWFDQFGIHVMASQNGLGEVVLGDSHEYDDDIEPFDKIEIDEIVLRYLATFLDLPRVAIASRWHGVYLKHPSRPWAVLSPEPNVTLVTGLGGAGMTMSMGLAHNVIASL